MIEMLMKYEIDNSKLLISVRVSNVWLLMGSKSSADRKLSRPETLSQIGPMVKVPVGKYYKDVSRV